VDPDWFAPDASEPLGVWTRAGRSLAAHADLRVLAFEFSSRGDRVPGRLLLPPAGRPPFPLVLLQHGAGGSKSADYLDAAAGPWVRGGAAVASIDFPLHGERADAKLSEALLRALADVSRLGAGEQLWVSFARQAVIDLRRGLDALATLPELDPARTAYAAFSLGSIVGSLFCAHDPRPRAAALAIGGGGFGPAEVDPARHIRGFAPRPVLFVNATRDERIPRRAAEALHQAAGEPKQVLWFETTHSELRGDALKSMWQFLRRHLEIG
jgi:fermentation-respiration switch protein FrsA (DUF1100 family)